MKKDCLKNVKWLILIVILSLVLLATVAVVVLSMLNGRSKEPLKSLSDFKLSDISGVDLKRPDGLYKLRQSEGKLYFENDPSFDLDQQSALSIATNSAYLCVKETPDPLTLKREDIGLKPAQYIITVYLKNNKKSVFYLGNQTQDKTGRYAMAKGSDTVVIIPDFADRAYTSSLDAMLNRSAGDINWAKFNKVELTRTDIGKLVVELNPEIIAEAASGIERMFLLTEPYKAFANPTKAKTLFDDLTKVRFDEYVGKTDDLKQYGLDQPVFQCAAYDSEGNKMEFNIGKSVSEGDHLFFYCNRPRDPENVFMLSEEKSAFSNLQAMALVDPVLFPKTKTESEVRISVTEGNSANQITLENDTCKLNGVEVSKGVRTKLLEAFFGLTITHAAEKTPETSLAATIWVDYGTRKAKVDIYEFDENLLLVDQGFGKNLCIAKKSFEDLLQAMNN